MFLLTGTLPLFATATPLAAQGVLTVTIDEPHTLENNTIEAYRIFDIAVTGSPPNLSYAYSLTTPFEGFNAVFEANSTLNPSGLSLDEFLYGPATNQSPRHTDATREVIAMLDTFITANSGAFSTVLRSHSVGSAVTSTTDIESLQVGHYFVKGRFNEHGGTSTSPFYALQSVAVDPATGTTAASPNTLDIFAKTSVPEVEKTADTQTAQIGDTVTFTVKTEVPDRTGFHATDGSYVFKIKDILSEGLTFDEGSVKVFVGANVDVTMDTPLTAGSDYTLAFDTIGTPAKDRLNIDFNWLEFQNYTRGHEIVVTYDATLNEDAIINGGNLNEVVIEYSNDPLSAGDGNPGTTTETPPEKVEVYTYELEIRKYSGVDVGNRLNDAQFVLVRGEVISVTGDTSGIVVNGADAENYVVQVVPDGGKFRVATEDEISAGSSLVPHGVMTTAGTSPSGLINVTGLDAGIYQLWEVKAPDGYATPNTPFKLEIIHSVDDTGSSPVLTTTAKVNDVLLINAMNSEPIEFSTGVIEIEIENMHGDQLPSTGGIGRALMYASGVMLMGGAGTLVAIRKKITGK
jgi:fimbrial isopeptide formation D2 family protein/LPXTG-motif cell wall-anchored protein